jgi:PAS domain S-box-containing protein
MTRTGFEIIGDVPWGTHFCQFYQTKQDLIDILVPYFCEGLRRNEFCMWITSEPLNVEQAQAALRQALPDLDDYLRRGQIEILDYSQWYTASGKFEADRVLQGWIDKEKCARQHGYEGLRLTGNTLWLEKKDWKEFSNYEAVINDVIGKYCMIALCTYSLESCGAFELIDVVSNHQFALIKQSGEWKIIKSQTFQKVETALRESEQRYQSLVELSPLAIAVHRDGKYVYVNPACQRLFGAASPEELVGKKVLDLVHPDDRQEVADRIAQVLSSGVTTPIRDSKIFRLDGELVHITTSRARINFDGRPAVQVVMQDNSERIRAEEALRWAHDALGLQIQEQSADLAKAVESLENEARRRMAVQDLVQEQSRILEAFFKHTINPLVILDKKFNFIRVNEAYANSCQRDIAEFAGHNHFEFYPSADNEAIFAAVVQSKKPYQAVAKPFRFPDHPEWGVSYWDWTLTPILDQNREVDFLVFSLEDVTTRVRAEKALWESEKRYRSFILATTEIVWTTNAAGEVVDDLPSWRAFTGQTLEESKGWGWSNAVHPEDRDRAKAAWNEAVRERRHYENDYRLLRHDGQYRNLAVRGVPVLEKDGSICEWIGTCVDVTDRKRMEEEIRSASLYARSLLEASLDLLVTINHGGQITDVNKATELVTGVDREHLIGSDFSNYFTDPEKADEGYRKVIAQGYVKDYPLTIRHRSGHTTDVLYHATVYRNEAGEVQGVFAAARDITERKQNEARLHALHEALEHRAGQLQTLASQLTLAEQRERRRLAQLMHDHLQQILYAARLSVGSIRRRIRDDELRQMIQNVDVLLGQCIDESRSLTMELSPPILYDGGLAAALEWLARQMLQSYGLAVEVEADPEADPEAEDLKILLFHSVRELLFNVVKHAKTQNAQVKMMKTDEAQVCIEVVDRGVGLQLDLTQTDDVYNAGFGLFSIRERLEQMGGRLEMRTTAGKGTRVLIFAPLYGPQTISSESAEPKKSLEATEELVNHNGHKKPVDKIRVLLADDHALFRKGLVGVLNLEPDIEVVAEAADGRIAVELARQFNPDVILMDVTMPNVDGIEATRRITSTQQGVCIIGLSAHEEEDMAQALYKAGAISYLSKDEPAEFLITTIRNLMSKPPSS